MDSYKISFEIATQHDEGIVRVIRKLICMNHDSREIIIMTNDEPNINAMMEYVYSPLKPIMDSIHSLNHLIHDDLSKILSPKKFRDLAISDVDAFNEGDDDDEDPHFLNDSKNHKF